MENPKTSYAWKTPPMIQLLEDCTCTIVSLDQCMYGLKIPDDDSNLGLALKPTIFAGTMPNLGNLERGCNHQHRHVSVTGGVKFKGLNGVGDHS